MKSKKTILSVLAAAVLTIGVYGAASAQSTLNTNHDSGQFHNIPQHEQQTHNTYHE